MRSKWDWNALELGVSFVRAFRRMGPNQPHFHPSGSDTNNCNWSWVDRERGLPLIYPQFLSKFAIKTA